MIESLRVVELAGSVAGGYAAKLLADRGATVTTVFSPSRPPFDWGVGIGLYLGSGKETLSLERDGDLAPVLDGADIVIESSSPDPLVSLLDRFDPDRRRIDVRISPFGSTGPRAGDRSTDLTDQAVSGHLLLNGDPDRTPLQGPQHQVAYAAGTHAAIGALSAVLARAILGRGQQVEVTHHEVMTALHQFTLLRYTHNGDILTRMGNRYAGPGRPVGIYRCGDGSISLIAPRGDQVETLVAVAGLDHLLDRPDITNIYDLMHHPTLLDEHLAPWLAAQDLHQTIELLQAVRVPAAAISTMADLLDDDHLAQRRSWGPVQAGNRTVRAPGSPIRTTVTGAPPQAAAESDPGGRSTAGAGSMSGAGPGGVDLGDGALAGLRVLDLTRVWAGPYATRILADLGADVIMIEAPWARGPATIDEVSVMATRYFPDNDPGRRHWNRSGFPNKYNINKRNLVLNLGQRAGVEVLESLIVEADVLVENYSPRVMPQFGLDDSRLHRLNPSLIYVTMPGFGRSGPSRDHVAYGPVIDSQAGLSVLMGYEGETARKAGVAWPDPVAGMHAAFATIAALVDRRADGRGRTVEVAQIEATIAVAGHAIVDRQLTGQEPTPIGNRHDHFVPQGVYRCRGEDRWLAISVVDRAAWLGLCRVAELPEAWQAWSPSQRRAAADPIDQAITAWTAGGRQEDLARRLQRARVPAAPVADAAQVMDDPQHRQRRFFVELEHPEAGTHAWPKLAIHLSETPATYRRAGPTLNQHATEILTELAGRDGREIEALYAAGVTTDRPPD